MAQDEKIDPEMKKYMEQLTAEMKRILDPVYKQLCELSEKINNTGTSGLEIGTPTGTFYWKPLVSEKDRHGRTIN